MCADQKPTLWAKCSVPMCADQKLADTATQELWKPPSQVTHRPCVSHILPHSLTFLSRSIVLGPALA